MAFKGFCYLPDRLNKLANCLKLGQNELGSVWIVKQAYICASKVQNGSQEKDEHAGNFAGE